MPADGEIGGAYLPPIAQALLLAWLILLLLNPLLRRFGVLHPGPVTRGSAPMW